MPAYPENSPEIIQKPTCSIIILFRSFDATITNTMLKFGLALLGLAATANATSLTLDNWDTETAGKTVLIKFQAPW